MAPDLPALGRRVSIPTGNCNSKREYWPALRRKPTALRPRHSRVRIAHAASFSRITDHIAWIGSASRLDVSPECGYSNYIHCLMRLASMEKTSRTIELKLVPIGNSRGVRLPKAVLDKYAIKGDLVLEEREEGLLLRNKGDKRLSWEDTFKQMAKEREDWSDLDATVADGLDQESKW